MGRQPGDTALESLLMILRCSAGALKRRSIVPAGILLSGIAACGGSTAPVEQAEEGRTDTPPVSGIWDYRTSTLSGARFSCGPLVLMLDLFKRSPFDVRGIYDNRRLRCEDVQGNPALLCCGGDSIRGTLSGDSISLDMAHLDRDLVWLSEGVVSGDSMGGTVRITFSYSDAGLVSRQTVRGDWWATR